jgi:hypothetical protein
MSTGAPVPRPDVPLLISLYVLEASALVALVASYKKGARSVLASLPSPSGVIFLVAGLALLSAAAIGVWRYRTWARRGPRRFGLTVVLNLLPVLVFLAAGELTIRMLSRPTPRGPMFMRTALPPWQWSDIVALNETLLEQASLGGSYLVPDEVLGWVVGPDRRSADGPYFSSVEGIRSSRSGVAFAERPAGQRVALVGDSFTFGLEVSYEDSWGQRLERALGSDVQVLNFGVGGYGVDQAYLRYHRDVRPWRPDVVIFGLIDHDLYRSLSVYTFVTFPEWPFPFAKPRFVMDGDRLVLLNVPLPSPRAILAARSIRELPFVEYDPGYREEDWEWRTLDRSYFHRFMVSQYRRWSAVHSPRERLVGLNLEILRAFIREAREEGSVPIVVYFPGRRELRKVAKDAGWRSVAQRALSDGDIPYTDLTPCLAALDPADRFGLGHYSPRANAAVAGCLRGRVLALLSEPPSGRGNARTTATVEFGGDVPGRRTAVDPTAELENPHSGSCGPWSPRDPQGGQRGQQGERRRWFGGGPFHD